MTPGKETAGSITKEGPYRTTVVRLVGIANGKPLPNAIGIPMPDEFPKPRNKCFLFIENVHRMKNELLTGIVVVDIIVGVHKATVVRHRLSIVTPCFSCVFILERARLTTQKEKYTSSRSFDRLTKIISIYLDAHYSSLIYVRNNRTSSYSLQSTI